MWCSVLKEESFNIGDNMDESNNDTKWNKPGRERHIPRYVACVCTFEKLNS